MPVNVYWTDHNQTILQYDFEGHWSWDEFYQAFRQALELETAVQHRVDVIVNMLNIDSIPGNALTHLKSTAEKRAANAGLSILVATHSMVPMLVGIAGRFHQNIASDFRVVATLDEAVNLIQRERAILN